MFNRLLFLILIGFAPILSAQENDPAYVKKKIAVAATVTLDSTGIQPARFKVTDRNGNPIDSLAYSVNYSKGEISFKTDVADTVWVSYQKYPEFLTKTYSLYSQDRLISNEAGSLYAVDRAPLKKFVPFEGLNTSGSITRGVTVGNNQNAVVNSNLDLQITGKLSDKVSLRASIQDSNIPLQEGGYSQKLDEFDQIFIELSADKWAVRAGDLFLENRSSRFLNFNKKVQGISTTLNFGDDDNKTTVFASGALVRGQYARSSFTGQEGNQGPYKLRGQNGELYVLVISGSERVFVNGILLKRGENNDYIIDYNAGEIIFTSLFPITSEMRINIEYQYAERNFTRFLAYGGAMHENENWRLGGYVYSESDVKNQPLQQNLTQEQAQVLSQAGDDPALMTAPSAFEDSYSENKILYRKVLIGTEEVFEYSNDPSQTLYNVRFLPVGNNQGNYVLASQAAIGRIYAYVPPIAGVMQGNYEPITRLNPPQKIQIATVMGGFTVTEKTAVDFEAGVSNNDLNLFSGIDDGNNTGFAGRVNARQRILDGKWKTDATADVQFVQRNFRTIERLFTIEFDRDWNLTAPSGDQSLVIGSLITQRQADSSKSWNGMAQYRFEKLDFSGNFSGVRHVVDARIRHKGLTLITDGSFLNSDGSLAESTFLRNQSQARYHFKRNWVGASFRHEDNQERVKSTGMLSALSQRFNEYGAFVGRGDSTKVYLEAGYLYRVNDSLVNGRLERVNQSDSYYVKSRLVQSERSDLTVFANYRTLRFTDGRENEPSLNSRVLYNTRFWDQFVQSTTAYETSSGTIAQQEFTFLEVEPGQGIYMWNDYNANGIQELQEFEIAPFPDQARYVRVFLPNQVFVPTHQNKFAQSLTLNPGAWQNASGLRKTLSYFYNQTSYSIDKKIRRTDSFDLNPFDRSQIGLLGLNESIRNSLFYNRGKQRHSTTYTFLRTRARSLLSVGSQDNQNSSHQLQYQHLIKKHWLVNLSGQTIASSGEAESYPERNFEIRGGQILPKISYLFSKNASWDVFYEFQEKQNGIGNRETLNQSRVGTSFQYASEKQFTANGEFSYYQNRFSGNALSPVAFQMLEGLLPGENMTWRLLLQKNLTQFLDINVSYQGRKSETTPAIHTGSVQLRAYF